MKKIRIKHPKTILIILGIYFIIVLSKGLAKTMSELNGYLYKKDKGIKNDR